MTITGHIPDLEPNKPAPRLELYFPDGDHGLLPHADGGASVLVINGVSWCGTTRTTPDGNLPYVWSELATDTDRTTCTTLFMEPGLAARARLVFEVPIVGQLHLREISNRG